MIPSATCRNDYQGSGSLATYSFGFEIFDATELVVLETTGTTTTTLVLNTDYTVSQNQDISTGGSITLTAGNLANGTRLTIIRNVALIQDFSFSNNSPFYPDQYEAALDQLEMQIQQLQQALSVSVQAPTEEVPGTASLGLQPISIRANTLLGFDGSGSIVSLPLSTTAGFTSFPNYLVANSVGLNALVGMTGGQIAYQQDLGIWWGYNAVDAAWEKVGFVLS